MVQQLFPVVLVEDESQGHDVGSCHRCSFSLECKMDRLSPVPWGGGAAIWDVSTVGADFDFIMDSSSSHDWKKQTLNSLSEIGITVLAANASTCRLTSVDTWFNTKYNFAICSNCNHNTYDVRTVAGHEFGHWLVLEDYPWYDFWSDGQCLMRDWHGTHHALCNDDVEGIIELYGED